jgi:hypothetical protein
VQDAASSAAAAVARMGLNMRMGLVWGGAYSNPDHPAIPCFARIASLRSGETR